jgi:hypothetical protein
MILGEPQTGAVYGFSHVGKTGGVVALRNPDMRPQATAVPVSALDPATEFVAQITYPYRRCLGRGLPEQLAEQLDVRLGPNAIAVVEIRPVTQWPEPVLTGCRYALAESSPGRATYDVFTEPGAPVTFGISTEADMTACAVEGETVPVEDGRVSLPARDTPQRLRVQRLPAQKAKGTETQLEVTRLDIPDRHQAAVRILADDETAHPLRISVNMGGWFGGLPYRFCQGDGWAAYDLELNARDMNVVAWGFPEDDAPPAAAMWLLRHWQLRGTRIRIEYEETGDGPRQPELTTPFANLVHDALCISDLPTHEDSGGAPWTDEYAESEE